MKIETEGERFGMINVEIYQNGFYLSSFFFKRVHFFNIFFSGTATRGGWLLFGTSVYQKVNAFRFLLPESAFGKLLGFAICTGRDCHLSFRFRRFVADTGIPGFKCGGSGICLTEKR
jgi:hypothetical protein